MLVAERDSDKRQVIAADESKVNGPWCCPAVDCRQRVALKKGQIKVHHFAHYPPVSCEYGLGETELHRRCKTEIYQSLLADSRVKKCALERNLGSVRPDISAYINNIPVAIEVQASSLTLDQIHHRTREYARKRIAVLWCVPWREPLNDENGRYSPRIYERWLHALYFGQVFYHVGSAQMAIVHFGPHKLWVEESSWYEDGEERDGGGYERRSKRWVEREIKGYVSILDLSLKHRLAWTSKKMNLPEVGLWSHT